MGTVDAYPLLHRSLAKGGHDDSLFAVDKVYLIPRLILFRKVDGGVACCLQTLHSSLHALTLCLSFIQKCLVSFAESRCFIHLLRCLFPDVREMERQLFLQKLPCGFFFLTHNSFSFCGLVPAQARPPFFYRIRPCSIRKRFRFHRHSVPG